MSGRIPQNFIDDLLNRTDIVDIIDSFVPLRKAGKNHQANCPFHDEKTPSFTVSQDKQFYHCFGCGANGTAITFVMKYMNMDFIATVEDLASRAGLVVPMEGVANNFQDRDLTELYELLELVIQFYCRQLREHHQTNQATNYLKNRGISDELVAKFEIGYAPPGWDRLINTLGKSDAAKKRLASCGMTIERDNGGYYDRFRDRIIYPIRDQRGRAIGFGGRVIDEGTLKYLNSPETPVFHKGRELYGLYQARHANKNMKRLYVVEGYMDVLALCQHGVTNSVATLGTAATSDHLEKIFRCTSEVIFCFDGDEAGQKAAWRAMENTLPLIRDGRQANFMFMPPGEDPDSFIRENGKTAFEDVKNYVPLSDYLIREMTQHYDPEISEQRSKLIHEISPYLEKLPKGTFKQIMIEEVARLTNSGKALIEDNLADTRQDLVPRARLSRKANKGERTILAKLIKLLLRCPKLALTVKNVNEIIEINVMGMDFLADLIKIIHKNPDINMARLVENWRGTKYESRLFELALVTESLYGKDDELLVSDSEEQLLQEFNDCLTSIKGKSSRTKSIKEIDNMPRPKDLSEEQKNMLRSLYPGGRTPSES